MIPAAKKNPQVKPKKKPVIYPEFELASMTATDKEWRSVLISASRGEFVGGITYDGVYIYSRGLTNKEKLPKNDPQNLYRIFVKFHKKYSNITSEKDIKESEEKEREILKKPVNLEWSKCSKKRKHGLLMEYARRKCIEENLSRQYSSYDELVSLLLVNFDSKNSNNTVELSNNVITKIHNIKKDKKGNWWIIND